MSNAAAERIAFMAVCIAVICGKNRPMGLLGDEPSQLKPGVFSRIWLCLASGVTCRSRSMKIAALGYDFDISRMARRCWTPASGSVALAQRRGHGVIAKVA